MAVKYKMTPKTKQNDAKCPIFNKFQISFILIVRCFVEKIDFYKTFYISTFIVTLESLYPNCY
jgi:hypothetical protein